MVSAEAAISECTVIYSGKQFIGKNSNDCVALWHGNSLFKNESETCFK